jgi:hypothetical protein
MPNLAGIVQQLKNEHDRLTRQVKAVAAALEAFGSTYARSTGPRRISAAGRAKDRGCSESPMGQGERQKWQTERDHNAEKANYGSLGPTQDCSGATRSMG